MARKNLNEFAKPCKTCDLRGREYSDYPDRDMSDQEVMVNIGMRLDGGLQLGNISEELHDPNTGMDIPSNRMPRAKACASRILAGECRKYVYAPHSS